MVTELVAPQLSVGSPPSGSIVLDELLRRYLISVGLRRFRALSVPELKHFALLAVYQAVRKRGLEGVSVEDFWNWVKPGEAYSLARLLPDTDDGRAYHAEQSAKWRRGAGGEETVILRKVTNVRLFISRVFVNLIVEELRTDRKQVNIKSRVQEENAPSARRGQAGGGEQQTLDEILRYVREQHEGADLAAARFVLQRVREKMSAQKLRIIDLLDEGYKPQEVAADLSLDVEDVYNTQRAYRVKCKALWNRLFGSK